MRRVLCTRRFPERLSRTRESNPGLSSVPRQRGPDKCHRGDQRNEDDENGFSAHTYPRAQTLTAGPQLSPGRSTACTPACASVAK